MKSLKKYEISRQDISKSVILTTEVLSFFYLLSSAHHSVYIMMGFLCDEDERIIIR